MNTKKWDWDLIFKEHESGLTNSEIVAKYGVNKSTLSTMLCSMKYKKSMGRDFDIIKKINLTPFIHHPLDTVGHIPKHLYKLYSIK